MEPERWRKVEHLFHSVLEMDADERSAFLEQACAGDPALRQEVESLLASTDSGAAYLEAPAVHFAARVMAQDEIRRSAPGAMVGHYRIVGSLGSGGMGEVYKAQDTKLGRLVALKFLRHGPTNDPMMVERFVREARTASALNHPNICSIYAIDEFEGEPFITMELLDGQSMSERIAAGPLKTDELLDFATQISDGLEAAHARGIIHRDLKPANLFLTSDNRVKLLDFGVAKLAPRATLSPREQTTQSMLTETGAPIGTVAYMSPEQARAQDLDTRTDLFSFGAVLYEMATGRTAFRGITVAVIFNAILSETPAPVSRLRPGLPPKLEEIINRALEKDRDVRYQDAAEIRADLKRLRRELELPPRDKRRSFGRRRTAWALAATVIGVGVAGIAWRLNSPAAPSKIAAEMSPLNGLPGMAAYPSLRPDGSQIAFAWDGYQHKNFHIYMQPASPGGGEPLALTSGDGSDNSPAWSPDGTQIAFVRTSQKPNESGVYVVPSSGGRERLLTLSPAARPAVGLARQLVWCKDGSLLVSDRHAESEPFRVFRIGNGSLKAITGPPADSFGDSDLACSPDASLLAFTRTEKSLYVRDVYLIPLRSPEAPPKRITSVHAGILGLAWARPRQLIFSSSHTGSPALWTVDIKSGTIDRLNGPVDAIYPTIASGMLAFSRVGQDSNIWALDHADKPVHGKPYPLIASSGHDAAPQLSPDGQTLAFASDRVGTLEIWIADADGRNTMRLTNFNKNPGTGSPRWSPDGTRIAFDCRIDENSDIYVIDRNGSGLKRLTVSTAEDAVPTWSRDGREIYFASNRTGEHEIWKLAASGGPAIQVTHGGGFMGYEAPDGSLYYVKTRDAAGGVWRKPVDGAVETPIVPPIRPYIWSFWAIRDSGIYFVEASGTNGDLVSTLKFQSFEGKSKVVEHLENLKRIGYPGLAVSARGDRIFYSEIDHRVARIMLMRLTSEQH